MCLVLAAAWALAGCDRCVDCRCTCVDHTAASGVRTKVVTGRNGFDCGQACERDENCGRGDVVASECLRTELVDGRMEYERCVRADAPATVATVSN